MTPEWCDNCAKMLMGCSHRDPANCPIRERLEKERDER